MQKFLFSMVASQLVAFTAFSADLNDYVPDRYPDVYQDVCLLPLDAQGYYGHHTLFTELIQSNRVMTAVEVGCWCGASTLDIAKILPSNGKLYAVDHWLGSLEQQLGQAYYNPVLHYVFHQFISNVIHEKLEQKIIPVRMSSVHAADVFNRLNIRPDFIYIDASHDYQSVMADLEAWYPLLNKDGIFCGDDYVYRPVYDAVNDFAMKKNLRIIPGALWQLVK